MDSLPLSQLSPGESAHLLRLDSHHPLRRRLLELGFVRGARIKLLRRAPLGDPVELLIGQTALALRQADLQGIEVVR